MDRTKRYDFGTPRYAYGDLERALGETLGADREAQQGALRGRLKRLSTLGLPPAGPGKGSRRRYSWEEANQLLTALLMEDAGLDPIVVVRALKAVWPKLASKVAAATGKKALASNPMWLNAQIETVAGPWRTKDPLSAVPQVVVIPRYDGKSDNLLSLLNNDKPGWFAVRNLTAAANKLHTALHAADLTVEAPSIGTPHLREHRGN